MLLLIWFGDRFLLRPTALAPRLWGSCVVCGPSPRVSRTRATPWFSTKPGRVMEFLLALGPPPCWCCLPPRATQTTLHEPQSPLEGLTLAFQAFQFSWRIPAPISVPRIPGSSMRCLGGQALDRPGIDPDSPAHSLCYPLSLCVSFPISKRGLNRICFIGLVRIQWAHTCKAWSLVGIQTYCLVPSRYSNNSH